MEKQEMLEDLAEQYRGEMAAFRVHLREAISHASRAAVLLVTPRGTVPRREWFRWAKGIARRPVKDPKSTIVTGFPLGPRGMDPR